MEDFIINHFLFREYAEGRYFLSNDFFKYCIVNEDEFTKIIAQDIDPHKDPELWDKLYKNFFILDSHNFPYAIEHFNIKYATNKYESMIVVLKITNYCNFNCVYCQASSDVSNTDTVMTKETAIQAAKFALSSPKKSITFEFQGGEPLSNFDIIKEVVEYTKMHKGDKKVDFRIMSNLAFLDDEKLEYLINNNISMGTSLDGPKEMTDRSRQTKNGTGIFDITYNKRKYAHEYSSKNSHMRDNHFYIGFLSTIIKDNLNDPAAFIKFYKDEGRHEIMLRTLFQIGKARDCWDEIGYPADDYIKFYKGCLDELIKYEKEGYEFVETGVGAFIAKLYYGINTSIEQANPCGAINSMISIDWTGDVVTCEGAKMLLGEERKHFTIGNVYEDSYEDIYYKPYTQELLKHFNSMGDPDCARCAYQPYCGMCQVERYISPTVHTYQCEIAKKQWDLLLNYMEDPEILEIFERWGERVLKNQTRDSKHDKKNDHRCDL